MSFVRRASRQAERIAMRLAVGTALAGTALGAPVAALATESFTFSQTIPVDFVIDGCAEPIHLTGVLRDILHITETDDGRMTLVFVTAAAGITGIGLDSGATYRGVGVTKQTESFSELPNLGGIVRNLQTTIVDRTRIVGTAGALTLTFKSTFHLTKLDNVPVVIWERSEVTCS